MSAGRRSGAGRWWAATAALSLVVTGLVVLTGADSDGPPAGGAVGSEAPVNLASAQSPWATLTWPTPEVVMAIGAEVAIYGYAYGATAVEVSLQDTATGKYQDAAGEWVDAARTALNNPAPPSPHCLRPVPLCSMAASHARPTWWFAAPTVDAAGHWRWMYTPSEAGTFLISVRLPGDSAIAASSTFSVRPTVTAPTTVPPTTVPPTTPTPSPGEDTTLAPGAPDPYAHSGLGEFVATCQPGHRATADPIVAPGNTAFAHEHQFFGNTTTDAFSTDQSLLGQPSTCDPAADSAAYWVPTLTKDGSPVDPSRITVYYQVERPQDPAKVRDVPPGLRMIAGTAMARSDQPDSIIQWSCIGASNISPRIMDCGGRPAQVLIKFPNCWDGVNLDSANHKSHLSYSGGASCDAAHPVLLPSISFRIEYAVSGAGVQISSDAPMLGMGQAAPGQSAHGDFINTWNQAELQRRIDTCLRAARVCNTAGVVIR